MNKKIYRTLLVCQQSNNSIKLIYGHRIEWLMTKLDYQTKEWKKCEIRNLIVFFKDLQNPQELSDLTNKSFLEINVRANNKDAIFHINFPSKHSERFFTPLSSKLDEFNPLNLYPVDSKVYYDDDVDLQDLESFIISNAKSLNEIKEEFGVDIKKYPYVLGSFFEFVPTRIFIDFKGFKDSTGFRYDIFDEFNAYPNSKVKLVAILNNEDSDNHEIFEFTISESPVEFNCGYIPDRLKTEIYDSNGKVIYESNYSILKSINLSLHVKQRSLKDEQTGEIIDVYSTNSFEVTR
jgi:hypothetical protein